MSQVVSKHFRGEIDFCVKDGSWFFFKDDTFLNTCVGYGSTKKECDDSSKVCSGVIYYGPFRRQKRALYKALTNGNKEHPDCPKTKIRQEPHQILYNKLPRYHDETIFAPKFSATQSSSVHLTSETFNERQQDALIKFPETQPSPSHQNQFNPVITPSALEQTGKLDAEFIKSPSKTQFSTGLQKSFENGRPQKNIENPAETKHTVVKSTEKSDAELHTRSSLQNPDKDSMPLAREKIDNPSRPMHSVSFPEKSSVKRSKAFLERHFSSGLKNPYKDSTRSIALGKTGKSDATLRISAVHQKMEKTKDNKRKQASFLLNSQLKKQEMKILDSGLRAENVGIKEENVQMAVKGNSPISWYDALFVLLGVLAFFTLGMLVSSKCKLYPTKKQKTDFTEELNGQLLAKNNLEESLNPFALTARLNIQLSVYSRNEEQEEEVVLIGQHSPIAIEI